MNNMISGTFFSDLLFDTNMVDFIFADAGNDLVVLFNDGMNDTALGQTGNDRFFILDSTGSNTINGGQGEDTANYSFLGESITLKAQGILEKASGGVDILIDIESIVGDVGFGIVNTIDGSNSGTASLDVNLGANSLNVNGAGVPLSFEVVNFDNVRGTDNNDTIVGNSNNNVFFGSRGHDTYDGGSSGFDTVDYSDLGQQITLKALGVIDKGSAGSDQLIGNPNPFTPSIDKIIGATNRNNLIDGRVAGSTPTTFNVDLAEEDLFISGFGGFEVVNFVNVIGTANADVIEGNEQNNLLFGQQGNDIIRGVDETSTNAGMNEFDRLVGGSGSDSFIIGDFFDQDYYLSSSTVFDPFGNNDYAFIFDFERGIDRLSVSLTNRYVIDFFGFGADVYVDSGFLTSRVDSRDDLIARVFFNSPIDLRVPPTLPKLQTRLTSSTGVNSRLDVSAMSLSTKPQFTSVDDVLDLALETNKQIDSGSLGKGEFSNIGIGDNAMSKRFESTLDNLPMQLATDLFGTDAPFISSVETQIFV